MKTSSGKLVFGKRLLGHSMLALRDKLIELAGELAQPIFVDTLLGMHFDSESQPPQYQSFLIFDFYRIFLYENSALPSGPKVNSVVRFLIDDYPVDPIKVLAGYAQEHFHFFYSVEILQILPLFWMDRKPGTLITLDLSNPAIRIARPVVHPKCEQPRSATLKPGSLVAVDSTISLQDRFTGPEMRTQPIPILDDLVSPDVGIVRRENRLVGQLSFPTVISQVANGHAKPFFCSGRGLRMRDAVATARCEAVERHLTNFLNPATPLAYGSYEMFRDLAINPQILCFNRAGADRANGHTSYNRELPMYWCSARNPRSGAAYLVPAQEVWFNTRSLPGENICIQGSTNGCALGTSVEEAALFAILETIERDAFLTTWYLRRPCHKVDPASVHLEEFQLLWHRVRHIHRNYSFHLFDITTDVAIPVVLCVAVKQSGRGPKVMLSTACRLHWPEAALSALKDFAGMPQTISYDETHARRLLERPQDISDPEDHAAFYSLQENFERLSFFAFDAQPLLAAEDVDARSWVSRRNQYNLKSVIEEVIDNLNSLGITVLLRDLTHRAFSDRNLFCLKAIIPGLYPMWFGYYNVRFNMSKRLQALSQTFLGRPLTNDVDVNLTMHPFD
ncbi:MAG TPA: YcaO-like family protein [Candidatus Sulfotelmatobacter sp.]